MISFTKADRLLQGVVPAVTVRLQESVPVVGQVAVPAEIAALEAALADEKETLRKACEHRVAAFIFTALENIKTLTLALHLIRRRAAIGGNDPSSATKASREEVP